ncbi:MAG: clostripain-related cysteine peptidase [Candidatus Atribacteria bacterium]|nr:clostripain-related cysteine peptidase [Candidatus Atribacteria bacterium]
MGNPSLFILRLTFFFIVLIFAFTLLITLGGCISGITSPPSAARGNTWTFMVFLNGDNDLDSEALPDITSMEQVGSTNKVKIVVQYDSLTGGANRYLIQKGDNPFQVQSPKLQDLGEVNMGDGSTLVDFIRFCATNYPADRYALVLWNHGYGFKGGAKDISYDETSLDDALTIPELSLALAEATSIIGHPLDLLGMDACLMALVEVAFEVRNTSRVLVASQENVPGEGWDYAAVLEKLVTQPTMTEKELSPIITESYVRQYPEENVTFTFPSIPTTPSMIPSLLPRPRPGMNCSRASFLPEYRGKKSPQIYLRGRGGENIFGGCVVKKVFLTYIISDVF